MNWVRLVSKEDTMRYKGTNRTIVRPEGDPWTEGQRDAEAPASTDRDLCPTTRKVMHRSHAEAERNRLRHPLRGKQLQSFYCVDCYAWHLGNRKKRH